MIVMFSKMFTYISIGFLCVAWILFFYYCVQLVKAVRERDGYFFFKPRRNLKEVRK